MELAAFAGINILDFWELTPFELGVAIRGYAKRREQEQRESIYQAYLISRWVWAKRVNIKSILKTKEPPKKEMTDEAMLEQIKALNKLFGGNEIEGGGAK